jgi:hypothetical protein
LVRMFFEYIASPSRQIYLVNGVDGIPGPGCDLYASNFIYELVEGKNGNYRLTTISFALGGYGSPCKMCRFLIYLSSASACKYLYRSKLPSY